MYQSAPDPPLGLSRLLEALTALPQDEPGRRRRGTRTLSNPRRTSLPGGSQNAKLLPWEVNPPSLTDDRTPTEGALHRLEGTAHKQHHDLKESGADSVVSPDSIGWAR